MTKIVLELEVSEALIALGPIQDRRMDASRLAATSTGEEHEIADLTQKLLLRVETQIVDALYPGEPTYQQMRREMLADEIELGMV